MMNKIEEKIKEVIEESMDQSGCSLPTKAIEGIASEKAQELIKDLAVSSPDQLEVRVDGVTQDQCGPVEPYFMLLLGGSTFKMYQGFVDENGVFDDIELFGRHIQLITPDGVVVVDNKKDEK